MPAPSDNFVFLRFMPFPSVSKYNRNASKAAGKLADRKEVENTTDIMHMFPKNNEVLCKNNWLGHTEFSTAQGHVVFI